MGGRRVNFTEDVKPVIANAICCQFTNNHGDVNLGILSLHHLYQSEFDLSLSSEDSVSVSGDTECLKVISFKPKAEGVGHHLIVQINCLEIGKKIETLKLQTSKRKWTLSVKYQVMKADDGKPLLKTGVKLLRSFKAYELSDEDGDEE